MKIYILYSDPYDEGAEVYGAFSTEEKAEKAREVFSSKANHELYVMELELDVLENHFERATSEYRTYTGYRMTSWVGGYGKWSFSPCGLDEFLNDKDRKNNLAETPRSVYATIAARSEKEAEEIAEELMKNLQEQPKDEQGWRFITE